MFFNRISFKILFWYSLSFLIGALALFGLTSYLLHSSLKAKDRELLSVKSHEYELLLERDGVSGLQIRTASLEIQGAGRFLVRYEDAFGKTLFLHAPPDMEIAADSVALQNIDAQLKVKSDAEKWTSMAGEDFGDDVEVLSRRLSSGGLLQVGKDTEDREEFFEQFTESFFLGLIPVLGLAVLGGAVLSARILSPIRWLTQTVQQIRSGQSGARVMLKGNHDDLDQLGHLFNQMQDQNESLIMGMKNTLDHVAHDLRTPVMRIQNSAQHALQMGALAKSLETTQGLFHEAIIECQESSETILVMLNAILDISEAETGTMALKTELIDAADLVASVFDLYSFVAEEKSIQLKANIPVSFQFTGDKGRLIQALTNLLDNAIKYSPEKSTISVRACEEKNRAIFEVKDQGMGIAQAEIPKIWDRLYRGDKSRSTRGLGLGLSVVQAIAKAHHGSVEVETEPSQGSLFRLSLPVSL